MSFHKPTKLQLAIHEAGHAYAFAALLKYSTPEQMGLGLDGNGDHHGWSRRRTILYRNIPLATIPSNARPSIEWQADVETIIGVAGPLAEFRHRHNSRLGGGLFMHMNAERFLAPGAFDTDGDFERIRCSLSYVEEPDTIRRFTALIDVADEILAANWPKVRALGRLLLARGLLNEDDLEAWFDTHPAVFHLHPIPLT